MSKYRNDKEKEALCQLKEANETFFKKKANEDRRKVNDSEDLHNSDNGTQTILHIITAHNATKADTVLYTDSQIRPLLLHDVLP